MSTVDYSAVAATITAALISRKPNDVEVRAEDAAKLYWQVRQALIDSIPKSKATASTMRA